MIALQFTVDKLEDWNTVANALVEQLQLQPELKHVLLAGNLGAGKTTLVQHIVKRLGGNDVVQSPTFSLINQYQIGHQPVYHLDLYRLNNQEDLIEAGIVDTLDSGAMCFIEWPELAKPFLGNHQLIVDIALTETGIRSIILRRI